MKTELRYHLPIGYGWYSCKSHYKKRVDKAIVDTTKSNTIYQESF